MLLLAAAFVFSIVLNIGDISTIELKMDDEYRCVL